MKKLAILTLVVIGLIGTAIIAAPFIAATDLAKRRIATQIEEWTGRPVTFVGEPRVHLFPDLSITINDAKIGNAPGMGDQPFVEMDALTCKLRLLPFLIGRTEVAEFHLVRPRFHLAVDDDGNRNWLIKRGAVITEAMPPEDSGSAAPKGSHQIAEIKRGRFKIIDGVVTYENATNGRKEELRNVRVNLRWPSVFEPLSGTGTLTWHDEPVEFNGSIQKPLQLFSGGTSTMRLAVASAPLKLSFTGQANALTDSQMEGTATISTPSLRRVASWLGATLGEGSILGAGRIEGNVNWIGRSISVADATMELDGNAAEGAIRINFDGSVPKILGTLAFEKLDLSPYAETFRVAVTADGPWQLAPIRLSFLDRMNVDLRVSANQLLLGSTRLERAAGTARIENGKAGFTIGAAQFYGGSLTGRASAELAGSVMIASTNVEFEAVPAGEALANFAGLSHFDGLARATLAASGHGESWGDLLETLRGSARLDMTDGAFRGMELGNFAAQVGAPGIRDNATDTNAMPFKTLSATMILSDGFVSSHDFHVESADFTADLDFKASLTTGSVRAKGVMMASRVGAPPGVLREIPFVIGGFWNAPLPLPDYERLIQRGVEAQHRRGGPKTGAVPVHANSVGPNG